MLKAHAYSLIVEYHKDEDGYRAYFPALPACHAWATSHEGAVRRAKEALVSDLEARQKAGRGFPIEKSRPREVSLGVVVAMALAR